MAQIPFLTNIILYRNVPLAPNYRDTVYFADHTEQLAWFNQFDSVSYTQQMYQRVGKNRVRLEGNPRQYEGVNYMRFQNYFTGAQNKLWYAFVLSTEYINENVFEVTYQIDVMQSFLVGVEYQLLDCYVEREHQATDVPGDNLLKEPVNIGDYVLNPVGGTAQNPTYLKEPTASLTPLTYVVAVMPLLDKNPEGSIKITRQPQDVDATNGQQVTFTVQASGQNLTYRWWLKVPNSNEWNPIVDAPDSAYAGYTTNTLYHTAATVDSFTFYKCVITDDYGYTVESDWAALVITSGGT